jgi:hypothetical protein
VQADQLYQSARAERDRLLAKEDSQKFVDKQSIIKREIQDFNSLKAAVKRDKQKYDNLRAVIAKQPRDVRD